MPQHHYDEFRAETARSAGTPAETSEAGTVSVAGEYFRSRDGKTIHLAPCPRMGNAVHWTYAEGKSLHAVVAEVAALPHLRLCRACWPADALAESGEDGCPVTTTPPVITTALVDLARRVRNKATATDYATWINSIVHTLGDIAETHTYGDTHTARRCALDLAATALAYAEHIDRQNRPDEQWATVTTSPAGRLLPTSVLAVAGQHTEVPERVQLDSGHRTILGPVRVGEALRALGYQHADDWQDRHQQTHGVGLFPVAPLAESEKDSGR